MITITDLQQLEIDMVFYHGELVAKEGRYLLAAANTSGKDLNNTVNLKSFEIEQLRLTAEATSQPVIEIIPGQIITKKRVEKVKVKDNVILPDTQEDILKLIVVERHKATGNIGRGLIKGFGLKHGALASSIAHDSHNIVAVGTNDHDIFTAIKHIEKMQGGLVVCDNGKVLADLPLPVAGLLSPKPLDIVVKKFKSLEKAASELGTIPQAPFALLSFIALPVIPELRLTDMGMVDVLEFKII